MIKAAKELEMTLVEFQELVTLLVTKVVMQMLNTI